MTSLVNHPSNWACCPILILAILEYLTSPRAMNGYGLLNDVAPIFVMAYKPFSTSSISYMEYRVSMMSMEITNRNCYSLPFPNSPC